MKPGTLFLSSLICADTAAFAAPAPCAAPASAVAPVSGVVVHECVTGKPTAASYKWDFKGEANGAFQAIQDDARQALDHADRLRSFEYSPNLDWRAYAGQLDMLKQEVNDMGRKICRLQVIRRATEPWQQAEIDRIETTVRLLADDTADAILFGNNHRQALWLPQFQKYADNVYNQAEALTHSVDKAVAYASASKDYQELRQEMGARTASYL